MKVSPFAAVATAALAAAVALARPASAQTTPAPAPGTATVETAPAAGSGAPDLMRVEATAGIGMLENVLAMQQQARNAMLSALTPAHRELLARIVGDLAVAPNPSLDGAATRIDAALSPAEIQALYRVSNEQRSAAVSSAMRMERTLQTSMTPDQLKRFADAASAAAKTMAVAQTSPALAALAREQSDPGYVLIATVLSGLQPYRMTLSALGNSAPR